MNLTSLTSIFPRTWIYFYLSLSSSRSLHVLTAGGQESLATVGIPLTSISIVNGVPACSLLLECEQKQQEDV